MDAVGAIDDVQNVVDQPLLLAVGLGEGLADEEVDQWGIGLPFQALHPPLRQFGGGGGAIGFAGHQTPDAPGFEAHVGRDRPVQFLHRAAAIAVDMPHRLDRGFGPGDGGADHRAGPERRDPDRPRGGDGAALLVHRQDDQPEVLAGQQVEHVVVLEGGRRDSGGVDHHRRHQTGIEGESHRLELAGQRHGAGLIAAPGAQIDAALGPEVDAGAELGLVVGFAEAVADAHHLAGRLHLRPEDGVNAGELGEGEHHLLDAEIGRKCLEMEALPVQRLADHAAGGDLGQRQPGGLGDEGNGARSPRVDLQHIDHVLHAAVDLVLLDGELHVHQADHLEAPGHQGGLALEFGHRLRRQRIGRQRAGGIAGMHPGGFDMLHHAADQRAVAVTKAIDVDLDGVFEEAVEQHRGVVGNLDRLAHVALEVGLLVDDLHRPPAQHVGGAHHQGIADLLGQQHRLSGGTGGAVVGLAQPQRLQQPLEAFAVLGGVDLVGGGADDRHPGGLERQGQLERGLAAELDDDSLRLLHMHDLEHVLQGQRLEIEAVGAVVVGGDGLGIAVDHDGLVAVLPERHRGMNAAIVELDALADAVGAAAQHHDLLAVGGPGLALLLVGRVHVGGVGGELAGAGVDPLVDRADAEGVAAVPYRPLAAAQQFGEAMVGETLLLDLEQGGGVQLLQGPGFQPALGVDDLPDLGQKPGVDAGQRLHLLQGEVLGEGVADVGNAVGLGLGQLFGDHRAAGGPAAQAVKIEFESAQSLLERLLEGAADGHHLSHRFHLGGEMGIGVGKLLEGEARNLGDDVVDAGLERGRGDAAGDLVAQLVEGVADGQLGRDLGDGKAGGLGSQGGGARHPRIHLDDDHAAVGGIDRELDVGAAGVDADLAQHRQTGVAHDLVFLVGQGLGRGDGDGIAGVDAHRVQVLDRADDDAIVLAVAHHLHLELFPADQRLLDQQFGGGRQLQAAGADGVELFGVVGDAGAVAAQREGGADDHRKAQRLQRRPGFGHGVGDARTRRAEADPGHRLLEPRAVLGLVDGLGRGADQFDAVLGEHAALVQLEGAVEGGLAAHGRQQGVGALLGDDSRHHLGGDRLDVGDVGGLRIRHDGGGIAVDQDHPAALVPQRLASLGSGIVEFASLADDDRPGADDQDAVQIIALRHCGGSPSETRNGRTRGRCRGDRARLPGDPGSRRPAGRCGQSPGASRRTARRG